MPKPYTIRDFAGGWSPSSDPSNIAKNAFLQMDNLRLNKNGAIQLVGGISTRKTYSYAPHSIFNTDISGMDTLYNCDTSGNIFRETTSIGSGGSATRACFSTAFDFTLICSGTKKLKDNGTTAINLGVGAATNPVTLAKKYFVTDTFSTWTFNYTDATGAFVVGGSQGSGRIGWSNVQSNTLDSYLGAVVAFNNAAPVNFSTIKVPSTSLSLPGGDDDTISFQIAVSVFNAVPSLQGLTSVQLALHWLLPDGSFKNLNFTFANDGTWDTQAYINFSVTRNQLNAIAVDQGQGVIDWTQITSLGLFIQSGFVDLFVDVALDDHFTGGPWTNADNLSNIEYMQVNVNDTGSYLAKSEAGPSTEFQYTTGFAFSVLPQVPADSQVTEIWVYRRGNTLADWRKVLVFTAADWTIAQTDGFTDAQAALQDGWDLSLISVQSIGEIQDIVGPFEGRWFYFTDHFLYPSDIVDPDLVNGASQVVRLTAGNHEKFQWARAINDEVILVGTSRNIYVLTGTFSTLPDGTIDIFYKPLNVKYPPVNRFASYFNGLVLYMATDGWRSISPGGQNPTYVIPATQTLYSGKTVSGYSAVDKSNTPVAIVQNSLFGGAGSRVEVYDFTRNYWYPISLAGTANAACESVGGLALFAVGNTVYTINDSTITPSQTFNLRTGLIDYDAPDNRKDQYSILLRVAGSGTCTLSYAVNGGASFTNLPTITLSTGGTDVLLNLGELVGKQIQLNLAGTVTDFTLEVIEIEYDLRPGQLTTLRIPATNYGKNTRKRLADQPFVIDTLGNTVTVIPYVDNAALTGQTFVSDYKETFAYLFGLTTNDLPKGVDYEYLFTIDSGVFEFYEMVPPTNIEFLPEQTKALVTPITNYGKYARKRIADQPFVLDTVGGTVTVTPLIDGTAITPFTYSNNRKQTFSFQFPLVSQDVQLGIDFQYVFSGTAPFEFYGLLEPTNMEVFPEPTRTFRFPNWNGGNALKKRLRVWPIELDLGVAVVVWTPIVDGVVLTGHTVTLVGANLGRKTYFLQYPFDCFGVDFTGCLESSLSFEIWKLLEPEIVQALPIAKRFDQVGPQEIGRYAKINAIEVRILAYGTAIPYVIYFQDGEQTTGTITTVNGVEATYELSIQRGIAGRILRIEFGPTTFDFHRYYIRVLTVKSGEDNERGWVTLPAPN